MPKLELAVSQGSVRAWVGRGGHKPSPVPIVTLGLEVFPSNDTVLVIEMTHGQTDALIAKLRAAKSPADPEGT